MNDGNVARNRNFYYGESIDRFDEVFNAFSDIAKNEYLYVLDIKNNFSRWSKSAVEDFGLQGEYLEDTLNIWTEYIDENYRAEYLRKIFGIFSGNTTQLDFVYKVRTKSGNKFILSSSARLLKDKNGKNRYLVCKLVNHTKHDGIDPYTGLYSSTKLIEQMKIYENDNKSYFVLITAIRDFFIVNGNYGYEFGNKLLNKISDYYYQKKKELGQDTFLFKADGTKFVFLLDADRYSMDDVRTLYNDLEEHFKECLIMDDVSITLEIYASALFAENSEMSSDKVYTIAMMLLNEVRKSARNELVIFDKRVAKENKKRLEMLSTIKKSVMNDCEGFYLCYQPIINVKTGEFEGMEALLRWQDEKFGKVSPNDFIAWLEGEPIFYDLGLWIIRRAISDAKYFVEKNNNFIVSINLAFLQLQRQNFSNALSEILTTEKFAPENVKLELTERCKLVDENTIKAMLEDFRKLGIKVVLDDFGTGYSALDLLIKLPVDQIKIDKSFIDDIAISYPKQCLLQAITSYARKLGKMVCIEGVENKNVARMVKTVFAVDSFQGYFYSKPIIVEELKTWAKQYEDSLNGGDYDELHHRLVCRHSIKPMI